MKSYFWCRVLVCSIRGDLVVSACTYQEVLVSIANIASIACQLLGHTDSQKAVDTAGTGETADTEETQETADTEETADTKETADTGDSGHRRQRTQRRQRTHRR